MLVYVAENPTTYVIVHKVDRLARNRADDVEINLALKAAGVTAEGDLVGAGVHPCRGLSFETLVGLIGRLSHLEVPGQRAK